MVRWLNPLPVAGVLLLAGVPACSGAGAPSDPSNAPAVAAAVTRVPVGAATHGQVKRIGEALGQVDLRSDQRATLERLAAEAEARQVPTEQARAALATALASQIEAGAIDRVALQPAIDALVAALRAQQPGDRAAFESVHEVLDPAQRAAFVEAMRTTFHAHTLGHDGHPLAQWAADLALTDAQRSAIHDLLHAGKTGQEHRGEWAHGGGHARELLDAFAADSFRFDDVEPARDPAVRVTKMTDHVLGLAEKALVILTPGQRSLAAAKVREHALEMP